MLLKLEPGKFYKDTNDNIWCCINVDLSLNDAYKSCCIKINNTEEATYFHLDGKHYQFGLNNLCLTHECLHPNDTEIDQQDKNLYVVENSNHWKTSINIVRSSSKEEAELFVSTEGVTYETIELSTNGPSGIIWSKEESDDE